jgi:L-arabinose isomerase
MKRLPRIGLLPLYLKLYDQTMPEVRGKFAPFLKRVMGGFAARDITVVEGGICTTAGEFSAAVRRFAGAEVDLIVTVHLAYSPSLESVYALARTPLPLLILDTTMDFDFGRGVDPARIMFNHGIHGVMDLASVLRRRRKAFQIVAGHVSRSDVLDRAAEAARAAYGARCLRHTKALRIGPAFAGMGDFSVDERVLGRTLGMTVRQIGLDELAASVKKVSPQAIQAEIGLDRKRFVLDLPKAVHARSVRVGLGVRRMLAAGGYNAFSMNFLAFQRRGGPVDTVPFLEASKAMSRGIGYAGEGDVLTAALVHGLASAFGRTTFTEIFCPDWKGDSLFLSHMGEFNPDVAGKKPRLFEKPYRFSNAQNPAVLAAAPAPGPAVFVNLAPGPKDTFSLIVAPVEMLGDTTNKKMRNVIRGWMRPATGVAPFLEAYSRHGGTHHSALVLGDRTEALKMFAAFAGMECVCIA